jgi:hypothetical protein
VVEAEEVEAGGTVDFCEDGGEPITRAIVAGTIAITAAINGTKVDFLKIDRTRRCIPVFSMVLGEVNLTTPRAGRAFAAVNPSKAGRRTQATFIRYKSRYLER